MWSAGRLFAIAACLVATYVLFAVTGMRVALRVREVPVPDLRNHTVTEATARGNRKQPPGAPHSVPELHLEEPYFTRRRTAP